MNEFVLFSLAIAGGTNLLSSGTIFAPLKTQIVKRYEQAPMSIVWWLLSDLVTCQLCISHWVGLPLLVTRGLVDYFAAIITANAFLVTFQYIGTLRAHVFEQVTLLGIQRAQFTEQQRMRAEAAEATAQQRAQSTVYAPRESP